MKSAPLIFIHYGDAPYLRIVLRTARLTNPEKRIVLLGDEANRKYARNVADFVPFEDLAFGADLSLFEKVFKPIQGSRHRFNKLNGTDFWLRFVFRRWFLIANFLEREGIDAFWTFDSDTLVLAPLAPREERLAAYDCTEQCRGECLNGYVASSRVARDFVRMINVLFLDEAYLQEQRDRLETHLGLAFNEMDAYREFRARAGIRSIRLSVPYEGEAFDDALAFAEDYEENPTKRVGRTTVKRLWTGPHGGLFARLKTGEGIRLLSANMSWMPLYLYRRLGLMAASPKAEVAIGPCTYSPLLSISYDEPLTDAALRRLRLRLAPVEKIASQFIRRFKPCP
jgi:hypothetical protein